MLCQKALQPGCRARRRTRSTEYWLTAPLILCLELSVATLIKPSAEAERYLSVLERLETSNPTIYESQRSELAAATRTRIHQYKCSTITRQIIHDFMQLIDGLYANCKKPPCFPCTRDATSSRLYLLSEMML